MTKGNDLAYPIEDRSNGDMPEGNYLYTGLTKREYFAAIAMQGLCANETAQHTPLEDFASMSVKYADSLIKALNETK